jgi:hypothetical protein
MGSDAMIYVRSFINIGSGIQKLIQEIIEADNLTTICEPTV